MVILNIVLALAVVAGVVALVAAGIRFDHRHRARLNRPNRRLRHRAAAPRMP